jgi:hypothetical protein
MPGYRGRSDAGVPTSIAGVSIDPDSPEVSRTVVLPSTVDPSVSIVATHLTIANIADQFGGSILTANTDGTITVNFDVLAFRVTCMAVCRYVSNANIELGIGIGDPSTMPNLPGESTDTPPAGTYISRFRDARRGEGSAREVTLQTPYFPVGKTRILGAKGGDKIFPLAWNLESTNTSVVFDDLIFVVEAIEL